jgi:hypothetical protein
MFQLITFEIIIFYLEIKSFILKYLEKKPQ